MIKKLLVVISVFLLSVSSLDAAKSAKNVKKTKAEKFLKSASKDFKPLRILLHLELSKSQREDIKAIANKVRKLKMKNRKKIKFAEVFDENGYDKTKLANAMKQKSSLKLKKYFSLFNKSYLLLTAKQKARFSVLLQTKKRKKK